ncbi:hypothetical protein ACGFZB_28890 [Streptomyces cinerochromogenes]|uniref:Uncharacterized protein n=1 Tax=Streptomyces cinerochromogenes TaxID=66422 RepID=A0ABW7BC28_9ACTN
MTATTITVQTVITDEELARIDAAADARRDLLNDMFDNGWSLSALDHMSHMTMGVAFSEDCAMCRNNRAHRHCLGCPDC